ncbi:DUF1674 domain-containing protein [Rhizobium sp. FKY42]|uniref:DUF1674 domain-containing protein n=1 Tax=Rhizobium sp. FKY42 TaxID=2562310 RepID=UPI0010C03B39|nr:DUF1674 domain-containing protein [Rhizobium sp. FKY42]
MPAPDNDNEISTSADAAVPERIRALSPAAQRALREAEERRKGEMPVDLPVEHGGRGGADPARFGDWEINGRAIDF